MIILIVMAVLFLLAVIGGLTAGLLQTCSVLAMIFYILASGAAVKYLLTPTGKKKKEGTAGKTKFRDDSQERHPTPAPDPSVTAEDEAMIKAVDSLIQGTSAAAPEARAEEPEPRVGIPAYGQLRELGAYEVISVGMARNHGYELTLHPKANGVFRAMEYNGTVYVTLYEPFEGVGSNLSWLGIQQVFTLRDDRERVLPAFPPGRLQLTVGQEAQCRFYDGNQLALTKKGSVYVTRKQ